MHAIFVNILVCDFLKNIKLTGHTAIFTSCLQQSFRMAIVWIFEKCRELAPREYKATGKFSTRKFNLAHYHFNVAAARGNLREIFYSVLKFNSIFLWQDIRSIKIFKYSGGVLGYSSRGLCRYYIIRRINWTVILFERNCVHSYRSVKVWTSGSPAMSAHIIP